jgi:hypothetical protein
VRKLFVGMAGVLIYQVCCIRFVNNERLITVLVLDDCLIDVEIKYKT